ncbi:MAG: sigma 54-interacting transcriptional regulator [Desulfamplus sp.]|nr:sigma 54-interacting transcriptional regulator [Desulfamplus sp.]
MINQSINKKFEFKCTHCSSFYSFELFQTNVLYFGVFLLVSTEDGYLGILCNECKKISINKYSLDEVHYVWNKLNASNEMTCTVPYGQTDFISLRTTQLAYNSFSNYSYQNPHLFYRDGIVISVGNSNNIKTLNQKQIYNQMLIEPNDYYLSYLNNSNVMGGKIAVYGVKKEDIDRIIELEQQKQKKIIPRYYYLSELLESGDEYCLPKKEHIFRQPAIVTIKQNLGSDKEKRTLYENINFLYLIEKAEKLLNVIEFDQREPDEELSTYEPSSENIMHNIIGSEDIISTKFDFLRYEFGIEMCDYHPEVGEYLSEGYIATTKDVMDFFNTLSKKDLNLFRCQNKDHSDEINPEIKDNFGLVERNYESIIDLLWRNFLDKNIQNILQKKSRDYRIKYTEEAAQIGFSTLSIAKLTFDYIYQIGELIKNKDSAKSISKDESEEVIQKIKHLENTYPTIKNIISSDYRMNEIKQDIIELYSQHDEPVLILGENGTGKELILEAIRETSKTPTDKVIKINCAALNDTLVESELFGYKKGAFTNASKDTIGKIEAANSGILFLDEIADLPHNQQAKFLRVLQEKTICRLGETKERKVNFRLICATNKDLDEEIQNRRFRADLSFRLKKGFTICIPNLSERCQDDIVTLSNYFLKNYNEKTGKTRVLSSNSIETLKAYHWPGNVRELEGVIFENAARSKQDIIEIDTSKFEPDSKNKMSKKQKPPKKLSLSEKQNRRDDEFFRVLKKNNWHRKKTADEMGVTYQTVYRRSLKLIAAGFKIPLSPYRRNRS